MEGTRQGRSLETPEPSAASPILVAAVPTPIGRVYMAATRAALVAIQLPATDAEDLLDGRLARRFPFAARRRGVNFVLKKTAAQLEQYFTGGRRSFSVRTDPAGTPFQVSVWREVARIPYASTRTYADIARAVRGTRAVRAVGAAQKANPLPIVVPCHRVIGSNGRLVGYEGGLKLKRWLLEHEQKCLGRRAVASHEPLAPQTNAPTARGDDTGSSLSAWRRI